MYSGNLLVKFTVVQASDIYFSSGTYSYNVNTPPGYKLYGVIGQFINTLSIVIASAFVNTTNNTITFNAREIKTGDAYSGTVSSGINTLVIFIEN